jgi:hypothetical protein
MTMPITVRLRSSNPRSRRNDSTAVAPVTLPSRPDGSSSLLSQVASPPPRSRNASARSAIEWIVHMTQRAPSTTPAA